MAEHHDLDDQTAEQAGMSRREFVHGVIVASAATTVAGLPTPAAAAPAAPAPATALLTGPQSGVLTVVLNRLIPPDGAMPGAGDLGMAAFIDKALIAAPHLRRHVVGILATLPDADTLAELSPEQIPEQIDEQLHRIEREQPEAFDLLLQATYTGYYSHPQVLALIGGSNDESFLDRFDPELLDEVKHDVTRT